MKSPAIISRISCNFVCPVGLGFISFRCTAPCGMRSLFLRGPRKGIRKTLCELCLRAIAGPLLVDKRRRVARAKRVVTIQGRPENWIPDQVRNDPPSHAHQGWASFGGQAGSMLWVTGLGKPGFKSERSKQLGVRVKRIKINSYYLPWFLCCIELDRG